MSKLTLSSGIPAAPTEIVPGLFLQVAAHMAQHLNDEVCKDAPVRPPFVGVLFTIYQNPGIRQGHCADNLGFDATTFGRYIDRLVRDGFVERSVPPEDRRAVTLKLTDLGKRTVEDCAPIIRGLEAQVRERMGDAEFEAMTALLVRFLEAFDHPLPSLSRQEMVSAG